MTARRSPTSSATTSCSPGSADGTRAGSRAQRPRPTSSTRSSARCCRASQRLRAELPVRRRRHARGVKAAQDNPTAARPTSAGITAPDDTTLVIKLKDTTSLGRDRRADAAGLGSGSGGVRQAVRHREPVDVRRASAGERAVHDREQRRGELTGYTPNKEIHLIRNPNWRRRARTSGPRTWTTSRSRRALPTPSRRGKKMLDGERRGQRRLLASAERDQAGGHRERPGPADRHPERRQPLRRAQHEKPPFDDINVRKAVIAGANRTDLRNTRGGELVGAGANALHAARVPRLRGGRRARGLRVSTSSPTRTAIPRSRPRT